MFSGWVITTPHYSNTANKQGEFDPVHHKDEHGVELVLGSPRQFLAVERRYQPDHDSPGDRELAGRVPCHPDGMAFIEPRVEFSVELNLPADLYADGAEMWREMAEAARPCGDLDEAADIEANAADCEFAASNVALTAQMDELPALPERAASGSGVTRGVPMCDEIEIRSPARGLSQHEAGDREDVGGGGQC